MENNTAGPVKETPKKSPFQLALAALDKTEKKIQSLRDKASKATSDLETAVKERAELIEGLKADNAGLSGTE